MTKLLITAEVAEILSVDIEIVDDLARRGRLTASMLGGDWVFVAGDVLAFIEDQAERQACAERAAARRRKQREAASAYPRAPGTLSPPRRPCLATDARAARFAARMRNLYMTAD